MLQFLHFPANVCSVDKSKIKTNTTNHFSDDLPLIKSTYCSSICPITVIIQYNINVQTENTIEARSQFHGYKWELSTGSPVPNHKATLFPLRGIELCII